MHVLVLDTWGLYVGFPLVCSKGCRQRSKLCRGVAVLCWVLNARWETMCVLFVIQSPMVMRCAWRPPTLLGCSLCLTLAQLHFPPRLPLNIVNPLTDNDATDQLDEINYTRAETKACGADPRFTKALVAAMSQRGTFSL